MSEGGARLRRRAWSGLPARLPLAVLAVLLALGLLLGGCEQARSLLARQVPGAKPEVQLERERTVSLRLFQGPSGGALAFVPIYIDGQGPYNFALDTGASHTAIDAEIADQLQLETVGGSGSVTGVTGATRASLVRLQTWRIGDVDMPALVAVKLDLPEPGEQANQPGATGGGVLSEGLEGLLGSDILSAFGAVTVDYERQQLILRPRGQ